ncbi:uncharacterized protein CLAFUR5_04662 [Fulvia fulva]|uniref:RRM domain-containing protein n=1 Tax=Passalora fulva TaxID=5499 RepID=A0A9Q8LF34_PASFU|nr:uncharacterized protein CLAFUR5_04662 [Fulvia fulva]UJO16386.1 hypothetical protein CLAFUR5_04662 [Fulvia fulva]WPV29065.1 hypothetical protein CLAFUW7_04696 [Fulvia fulva]
MSTFDGNVAELPDIRIDRFTRSESLRPPLALFLSHVHTDHLVGLETCKSPFIYCSPATREILLRLEKYPHRMNFAKGILESRKQTYKTIGKLLKPIPLETPTTLELAPGRSIRVTLFDANHCVGAVMFLIEDENKAILYTGDIRSELWWVNSLIRNPLLLPYVAAKDGPPLKRLDTIYLDTTFASKKDHYRQFPTKASGVMELLRQVSRYPADTLFYFDAWTFGYEEVWQALSIFLGSQIHVDDYRYELYKSLFKNDSMPAPEAFKLIGAKCGNHIQEGCLSTQQHRIHSCEKGTGCSVWNKNFVRITPIISRHEGRDMPELGAGGGHGDLNQHHALDVDNEAVVSAMMQICAVKLPDQPSLLDSIEQMLTTAMNDPGSSLVLDAVDISQSGDVFDDLDGLPLESIPAALAKRVTRLKQQAKGPPRSDSSTIQGLPKQITFPYSRHSSFGELCHLIEAFMPKDILPCTVEKNWKPTQSMGYLFGHLYDQAPVFRHDQVMLQRGDVNTAVTSRPVSRNRYSQNTQDYDRVLSQLRSREVSPPQASRRRSAQKAGFEQEDDTGKRKKLTSRPEPSVELCQHSPLRGIEVSSGPSGHEINDAGLAGPRSSQGDMWLPQDLNHYSPTTKRAEPASKRRLYIGGLANHTTETELKDFFKDFAVSHIDIPTDPQTKGPARYAFATMPTISEAERAVNELAGKTVMNRKVKVELARRGQKDASTGQASKRRKSSTDVTRATSVDHTPAERVQDLQTVHKEWTHHPLIVDERSSPSRQINSWRRQTAEARRKSSVGEDLFSWDSLEAPRRVSRTSFRRQSSIRESPHIQPEGYGRLSPITPPAVQVDAEADIAANLDGRDAESVMKTELDEVEQEAELRLALQHEAYHAALGEGELKWSEIGLVSVHGHQVKEEEL